MGDSYLWIKTFHIVAVIAWMAGLFYLPRLFVYHVEYGQLAGLPGVFLTMERRLLSAIMRPAAFAAVGSGILLIYVGNWFGPVPVWLWLKLLLVAGMVLFHGMLEGHARRLRLGQETRSSKYFRLINEIPTVLLIGIVGLVIFKPI